MHINPHPQHAALQQYQLQQMQAAQRASNQMGPQIINQLMQQLQMQALGGQQPMQQNMNPQAMLQQLIMMLTNNGQMQQQQQMQNPNAGRFAAGQATQVPRYDQQQFQQQQFQQQPPQPQQQFKPQEGGRYSSQSTKQEPVMQVNNEQEGWYQLVVEKKPVNYAIPGKFSFTPKVSKFNPKALVLSGEKVSLEDNLLTAIANTTGLFEEAEPGVFAIETRVTIPLCFPMVNQKLVNQEKIQNLFSGDAKDLYRRARELFADSPNIETNIVVSRVNELFTTLTNEYLLLNFGQDWSIDNYSLDFNDLLKAIRDNFEDEEDDLVSYLEREIANMHDMIVSCKEAGEGFNIMVDEHIVRHRSHHFELGLNEVTDVLIFIPPDEDGNTHLNTMFNAVFNGINSRSFYLVTLDQLVFRVSANKANEYFIKRIV